MPRTGASRRREIARRALDEGRTRALPEPALKILRDHLTVLSTAAPIRE